MNASVRLSRGRADPFGLLVVAVMLALLITIGIQAQASVSNDVGTAARLPGCVALCLSAKTGQ